MALLLHVHAAERPPLAPFDGHLVRNLAWDRFDPDEVDDQVHAVVVSAASAELAHRLAAELRRRRDVPVVLVADEDESWTRPTDTLTGVDVVQDVTDEIARSVAHSLGEDSGAADEHDEVPPSAEVVDLRRMVPHGGTRNLLRERLGDRAHDLGASARAFVHESSSVAPVVTDGQTKTHQHDGPPDAMAQATGPSSGPSTLDAEPPAPRQADASERQPSRRGVPDLPAGPLVRQLMQQVDRLYGVRETADAVASHLKETVGVDAAAVLIPDGGVWAVAGAIGHRHLEERLTLSGDHWLVAEVSRAQHGLVIADTDIARSRLGGVPLAALTHLLAAPLPDVDGMALLARGDHGPAFTTRDLKVLARALEEADGLFVAAVELRELARRLRSFAELDDDA